MQKSIDNYALSGVASAMRGSLPLKYLVGVILSYIVNAGLIAFLLYPVFLRIANGNVNLALLVVIAGAVVVQYFRYLIIFTDQLVPNGVQSSRGIVRAVAFSMWLFSAFEVYHAAGGIEWLTGSQFVSIVAFGWGIVTGGYVLEISFVKKLNELTDIEVGEGYENDSEVKERIRQKQDARRNQKPSPTPPQSNDTLKALKYFTGWSGITMQQWEQLRSAIDQGATERELKDLHLQMIYENGQAGRYKPGGELENHPIGDPFQDSFSKNGNGAH